MPQTANGTPVTSGWADIDLYESEVNADHLMAGPTSGLTYYGLPAIGFAATRIINGAARPGLLANYAGASSNRGTLDAVLIETSPEAGEATR